MTDPVSLRRVTQADTGSLFHLAMSDQIPWRWQGAVRNEEGFTATLWAGVLDAFTIRDSSGSIIGYCSAYGANFHHGHCYFLVGLEATARKTGWPFLAARLLVDHLFHSYSFHKIYAETTDDRLSQFGSGDGYFFQSEAVLSDHIFADGRRQDVHILSITREQWQRTAPQLTRSAKDNDKTGGSTERVVRDVHSAISEVLRRQLGPDLAAEDVPRVNLGELDSLCLLELLILVEDILDIELPEDVAPAPGETIASLLARFAPLEARGPE